MTKVINQVIRLVSPKAFELVTRDLTLDSNRVIVRPTYLSICHADQRYYKGTREKSVLESKLPMSLIHEAVGEVQYDPLGEFQYGDTVVLVPNIPGFLLGYEKTKSVTNLKIGENYCPKAKFRSSGYDGFMQELVSQPRYLTLGVSNSIEPHIYALTELISVCMHAYKRFSYYSNGEEQTIGVWGDGNIAFLMALILHKKMPKTKIIVYGKHREKLETFSFVDEQVLITENLNRIKVEHFFECVGGIPQSEVLGNIIEIIEPGGTISVLGVSEKKTELNVRLMMEKGLIMVSNSRSGVRDFEDSIKFMQEKGIDEYLTIIASTILKVRTIQDIHTAFELDSVKSLGKTLMKWEM